MIYFLSLIPATALTIAGYFALFLSNRSEGAFRAFGKYLGFWAFTLAGLLILGAIFAAAHGGGRCGMMHAWAGHGLMHGHGPAGQPFGGACSCDPRDALQSGGAPSGGQPEAAVGAPPAGNSANPAAAPTH